MVTSMARFLAQLSRRIMGAPQLPNVFSIAASHTMQASQKGLHAHCYLPSDSKVSYISRKMPGFGGCLSSQASKVFVSNR